MTWPMIELTGVICGRTSVGQVAGDGGEPLLHDLPGDADVGAPVELDVDDRQPERPTGVRTSWTPVGAEHRRLRAGR